MKKILFLGLALIANYSFAQKFDLPAPSKEKVLANAKEAMKKNSTFYTRLGLQASDLSYSYTNPYFFNDIEGNRATHTLMKSDAVSIEIQVKAKIKGEEYIAYYKEVFSRVNVDYSGSYNLITKVNDVWKAYSSDIGHFRNETSGLITSESTIFAELKNEINKNSKEYLVEEQSYRAKKRVVKIYDWKLLEKSEIRAYPGDYQSLKYQAPCLIWSTSESGNSNSLDSGTVDIYVGVSLSDEGMIYTFKRGNLNTIQKKEYPNLSSAYFVNGEEDSYDAIYKKLSTKIVSDSPYIRSLLCIELGEAATKTTFNFEENKKLLAPYIHSSILDSVALKITTYREAGNKVEVQVIEPSKNYLGQNIVRIFLSETKVEKSSTSSSTLIGMAKKAKGKKKQKQILPYYEYEYRTENDDKTTIDTDGKLKISVFD